MYLWMTGTASPVTTVGTSHVRKTASTARHVTRVFVMSVSATVVRATLHCAKDVCPNAPFAKNRFVKAACQYAENAVNQCVLHV